KYSDYCVEKANRLPYHELNSDTSDNGYQAPTASRY
ncbi:hypothetical protein KGM_206376B, partial [Danaus plexippus plexippus]